MATLPPDHAERMERVHLALDGLSVGDAFGQRFFYCNPQEIAARRLPPAPWKYTDDTEMALALASVLNTHGEVDQDALAQAFTVRYRLDPHRGYGAGMHTLLPEVHRGRSWREASLELFRGEGSFGNGSAMRVAPVGAYFADDLERAAQQAALSAEVTHCHAEGIAGAIAIAVATAWAWQRHASGEEWPTSTLLEIAHQFTPPGVVRNGIERAQRLALEEWNFTAAELLGNGSEVTCPDTVPFCLWIAARHLDDYCQALWNTVPVGGDVDTNAAIIGGIVAMATGRAAFPEDWRRMRESLLHNVQDES